MPLNLRYLDSFFVDQNKPRSKKKNNETIKKLITKARKNT
jgi:hypothetical protein